MIFSYRSEMQHKNHDVLNGFPLTVENLALQPGVYLDLLLRGDD
jgi:hypothetical protein